MNNNLQKLFNELTEAADNFAETSLYALNPDSSITNAGARKKFDIARSNLQLEIDKQEKINMAASNLVDDMVLFDPIGFDHSKSAQVIVELLEMFEPSVEEDVQS